jgi:hypothetical protein
MPHLDLERLRQLEDIFRDGDSPFGEVGLFLHEKLERATYASTPRNSLTFASTGGDGVHFGFLLVGEDAEAWPVVMTVPTCFGNPNVIVGESLVDFLALGTHDGFFGLEQLAYRPAETAALLEAAQPRPDKQTLLDAIAVAFSLRRWTDVAGRLAMLDARFQRRLEVRDDRPSERPKPIDPEAFWKRMIAQELAKPPAQRNAGTIRHMRGRLAEVRAARRKR